MLLRNAISKAKKLFHKIYNSTSLQSFKAMISGGYQKLPKAPSLNPFSCRQSKFHQSFKELDQLYSQWESEQDRNMELMMKNKQPINESTPSQDVYSGSFMNFGNAVYLKEPMKMDRKRKEIVKEEEEEDGGGESCCSEALRMDASFIFEQKLKELELMDMSNVEHVLDIAEVLHCYSRLTCPFYVDIVNKFFMDVYSEFISDLC